MESGSISDAQITASSEYGSSFILVHHLAEDSRLHTGTAWAAATNDASQWLQIDLGVQYPTVTRVATQGCSVYSLWVTEYKLQFSINDGVTFHYYVGQEQVTDKVRSNKYKYLNINLARKFCDSLVLRNRRVFVFCGN